MALNFFRRLMPQGESFTELFCTQAKVIGAAAQELQRLVAGEGGAEARIARISQLERDGDIAAKRVFVAANRTFNAPLDREDILGLAHELDDVTDLIEDFAKVIQRYRV